MQIDLLEPERSHSLSRLTATFWRSPELRIAILMPLFSILVITIVYIVQTFSLGHVTADAAAARATYDKLADDEHADALQARNYEQLQQLAGKLFRLRRSAVVKAREIVQIGDTVYANSLHLTSITDNAADQGVTGYWVLSGEAVDTGRETCFSAIASALPEFETHVDGIASAIPSNSRSARDAQSICTYTIMLMRTSE